MTFPAEVHSISDIPLVEGAKSMIDLSVFMMGEAAEATVLELYESWRPTLDKIAQGDLHLERKLGTLLVSSTMYGINAGLKQNGIGVAAQ